MSPACQNIARAPVGFDKSTEYMADISDHPLIGEPVGARVRFDEATNHPLIGELASANQFQEGEIARGRCPTGDEAHFKGRYQ